MKYAWIESQRGEYPVCTMCGALEVSEQGYYLWRRRSESGRERENRALAARIRVIHAESRRRYGSPRIRAELAAQGVSCNHKRVERLMREEGLRAKQARKFKATTNSKHDFPVAENLLRREFSVAEPNRVWVTDMTYLWTREGWLYLVVFIDLYSRMVAGWALGTRMTAGLAVLALQRAVARREPQAGLIVHSDRGVQYASDAFREELEERGFNQSMSRKGDCWDNAVAESFFHSLKVEAIYGEDLQTRREMETEVFQYIEGFYNKMRRHSTLGNISPVEYESRYAATAYRCSRTGVPGSFE